MQFFHAPVLCVLITMLCLSGCTGKQVRVSSETEFTVMAQRLAPVLRDRGVIDAEGAYIQPLFGAASLPPQFGDYLFRRLSPAFRFQVDPSLLPSTFAASKTPEDSVEIRSDGFVLGQGLDVVTVTLLAETDWNDDGIPDWLLLCRVKSIRGTGLRDYYLVVTRTDAPILRPELVAVYDCMKQTCKLFITPVSKGKKAATPAYDPELPVVDVKAGQRNITLPPGTPPPDTAPKSTLHEQKISG